MDRQGNGLLFFIGLCILYIHVWILGYIDADDVPDNVVYTDLHKTVQREDSVVLKCQFRGTPLAVYWKKGNDPRTSPILINWYGDRPRTGSCVDNDSCDMDDDFSLIIRNIMIEDQGRYICRVMNYKRILIYNFTDVEVTVPPSMPREPYPIIDECQESSPNITSEPTCTILTLTTVNLTCSAFGFYPNLHLYFVHGSENVPAIGTVEETNDDMTKNRYITIQAPASANPYVCLALDILRHMQYDPVTRFATAFVRLDTAFDNDDDDVHDAIVYKPGFIAVCIYSIFTSVVLVVAFLWRKRRRRKRNTESPTGDESLSREGKSIETVMPDTLTALIDESGKIPYDQRTDVAMQSSVSGCTPRISYLFDVKQQKRRTGKEILEHFIESGLHPFEGKRAVWSLRKSTIIVCLVRQTNGNPNELFMRELIFGERAEEEITDLIKKNIGSAEITMYTNFSPCNTEENKFRSKLRDLQEELQLALKLRFPAFYIDIRRPTCESCKHPRHPQAESQSNFQELEALGSKPFDKNEWNDLIDLLMNYDEHEDNTTEDLHAVRYGEKYGRWRDFGDEQMKKDFIKLSEATPTKSRNSVPVASKPRSRTQVRDVNVNDPRIAKELFPPTEPEADREA